MLVQNKDIRVVPVGEGGRVLYYAVVGVIEMVFPNIISEPYKESDHASSTFAAFSNDVVVGGLIGHFSQSRAAIRFVGCCPEYQHQGIGRRLVKEFEGAAKLRGLSSVVAMTDETKSIWYGSMGYHVQPDSKGRPVATRTI